MKKPLRLRTPVTEEDVLGLHLGDIVYLEGTLFTARTLFHLRALREDKLPPLDFTKLNVMLHVGPVMKKNQDSWIPLSVEPTTSMRVEKYAAGVIGRLGLRALIGKGSMGPKTAQAMKSHRCVHLAKIGINGTALARQITKVVSVYGLEELGPIECTWVVEVKDFGPFFVDIDAEGRSFFEDLKRETQKNLHLAYKRFSIPEP